MARQIAIRSLIIKTVFSALFGVVMMMDRRIVVNISFDHLLTSNSDNYVGATSVSSILALVISATAVFALLTGAERLASSGWRWVFRSQVAPPSHRWFWIFTITLSLAWLPWWLSNLPGGVFYDTYAVYRIIDGTLPLSNQQPIFYTGINAVVFWVVRSVFHGSIEIAVFTMTMLTYSFMALSIAYFLYWLLKHGVSRVITSIVLSYFVLLPLFSYYASSNGKDTWFSIAVFLFAIKLVDVVRTQGESLRRGRGVLHYITLAFLICWFRNNGIYVVAVTTISLLIIYRHVLVMSYFHRRESGDRLKQSPWTLREKLPLFLAASVVLIFGTGLFQGPVFSSIGWNKDQSVETYGIPIQQICSIIANGGRLSDADRAVFDQIVAPKVISVYFSPLGVDEVKSNMGVQAKQFLSTHQGDFLRVWLSVVSNNPRQAFYAYLLTTLGFWDPVRGHNAGYMQHGLAPGGELLGLKWYDVIHKVTGHSFNAVYAPRYFISSALFCWLTLFMAVVLILRRKSVLLLPFAPLITLWGTILIATPIAFGLRYVYAFVPFLALAVILAFGSEMWLGEYSPSADVSISRDPATDQD